MGRLKKTIGGGVVLALAAVGLVITATAASAHDAPPSGSATCTNNTTWEVDNGSATLQDTPQGSTPKVKITVSAGTVSQTPASSATEPNGTHYTYTVSGISLDTASITVTSTTTWTDGGGGTDVHTTTISKPASNCTTTTAIPAAPLPNPPTCAAPGSVVLPTNSGILKWTTGPGVNDVTVHIAGGNNVTFTDGTTSHHYTENVLPQLSGVDCTARITPPTLTLNPATCSAAGSLVIPANTASVKWLVDGNQLNAGAGGTLGAGTYAISAHTTADYLFTGDLKSVSFNETVAPQVTGVPCYTVVTPQPPVVHPVVCDTVNGGSTGGTFDLPADTAGIHYAKAGLSAVATLQAGYKFPTTLPTGWALNRDGTASYKVTYAVTEQRCPILAHPSIPILSLPQCSGFPGLQADYTITSPITVGVIYYLYGHTFTTTQVPLGTVVTVTATPATGYFFTAASLPQGFQLQENGSATISWNTDALRIDCDVVVTPVTPTLDQNHCDTTTGLITFGQPILPANTPGITYSVKGYVVTADLSDGYVFSDDISANWVVDEDGGSAAYTLVPFTSGTCVKVVVVNPPPAPPVTPAVSNPPLAFTGAGNNIVMGGIAAFLVLGGMALLFVGRRRKA